MATQQIALKAGHLTQVHYLSVSVGGSPLALGVSQERNQGISRGFGLRGRLHRGRQACALPPAQHSHEAVGGFRSPAGLWAGGHPQTLAWGHASRQLMTGRAREGPPPSLRSITLQVTSHHIVVCFLSDVSPWAPPTLPARDRSTRGSMPEG